MQAARRCRPVVAAVLAGTVLSACGGAAEADPTAGSPITDQGNDPNRLEVRSAVDERAFVPTEMSGKAGEVFTVRFANASEEPHSWVLVRRGDEQAALAAYADDAAGSGGGGPEPTPTLIIPVAPGTASAVPVPRGDVLVDSGGVVEPNSARVIQVVKPPAGDYTYLCSVPGHADQGMRGTLTVG